MEGRHFAVITSIIIWIICYFISLFFFSYRFSNGIIPRRLREKTDSKTIIYLLTGTILISPIIAGLSYRIGGIMEKGNGIAWGCYIESFWLGSISLWFISLIGTSILLLVCIIKPSFLGFEKRKKAITLYILHNIYTLILLIIIGILIPIISGPLSGKGSTCL